MASKVRDDRSYRGRLLARRRSDGAYTLTEILISLAILGIIMVPLLAWMLLTFQRSDDTRAQNESADLAALGRTFARDVQGADTATVAVNTNDAVCGSGAVDPSNPHSDWVVGVRLDAVEVSNPETDAQRQVVTQYVVKEETLENGTTTGALWRRRCIGPVGHLDTPDNQLVATNTRLVGYLGAKTGATSLVDKYAQLACLTADQVTAQSTTTTTTTTPAAAASDRCEVVEAKFKPLARKAVTLRAALRADEKATTEVRTRAVIVCSPSCTGFRERVGGVRQMTVNFDGSRSRVVDAYLWNFGDGTTSNLATPGDHTYVCESGQSNWDPVLSECRFTVTLTVVGGSPRRASRATQEVTVKNSVPKVVYTPTEVATTRPGEIIFNTEGTTDADGDVTYTWNFGDPLSGSSNTASGATVTHKYQHTIAGSTATLTVDDGDGSVQTFSIPVKVENAPPVARFTTASANPDNAGDPSGTYVIQFCSAADCETPEARAMRTFTFDGKYRADNLDAYSFDPDGTPSSTDPTVAHTGPGPVASYSWSVLYKASADGATEALQIDPVDASHPGIGTSNDPPKPPSSAGSITVVFPNRAGLYEVVLKVTDADGATDVMRQAFTTNAPPRAVIDMVTTTKTITRYSTERFSMTGARSFDPDTTQPVKSYRWVVSTVPSGTVVMDVTNATPEFTPDLTWGRYRIKLFVRDVDNGVSAEIDGRIFADRPVAVTSVNLKVNRAPQTVFPNGLANKVERNVPFTFSVVNASGAALPTQTRAWDQAIDSTDKIASYTWSFKNITAGGATIPSTTTAAGSATITVGSLSTVAYTLTTVDNDGASTTVSGSVDVVNAYPTALFNMSPDGRGVVGEPVTFTSASTDVDGGIAACRWTFQNPSPTAATVVGGPSDNAACSQQSFTWSASGTYNVTLEVWDGDVTGSKSASLTKTMSIFYKPTATFVTNPALTVPPTGLPYVMVPNGSLVSFNPAGTQDDPHNSPNGVSLVWDWGDGTPTLSSSVSSQQHTFDKSRPSNVGQIGQYKVTLTVTNRVGLTATKSVMVVVNNNPVIKFDVGGVEKPQDFELVANCPVNGADGSSYDDVSGCVVPATLSPPAVFGASQSYDTDAGPNHDQTQLLQNIGGASICWSEDNPNITSNPTCLSTVWNNPTLTLTKFPTVTSTPKVIWVKVKDAGGASSISHFHIRLNRRPQAVEICGPSTSSACNSPLNFQWNVPTNSSQISTRAYDTGGTLTYAWTFKDVLGNVIATSTAAQPAVTFPNTVAAGTVELTVTDNDGYARSAPSRSFTVGNAIPVAVINVSAVPGTSYVQSGSATVPDRLVQTGASFSAFTANLDSLGYSYDPDNIAAPNKGISDYQWKVERQINSSTWQTLTTPATPGNLGISNYPFAPTNSTTPTTFRVTLTVQDATLAKGTKQLLIRFNKPPVAAPDCPSPRKVVHDTVTALTFTNNGSADQDGNLPISGKPATMKWTWGDGTETTAPWAASTTKTYTTPNPNANGGYDITLVVTDEDGVASAPVTCSNAVRVNRPPVAIPETTTIVRQLGATTTAFSGTRSNDPDNDVPPNHGIQTFAWTLFQGGSLTPGSGTAVAGATSSAVNPTFTLPNTAGVYYAELTVTDISGGTDTKRVAVRVNAPPTAVITTSIPAMNGAYDDLAFGVGATRPIDASNSTDSDSANATYPNGIKSYLWEFRTESGVLLNSVTSSTPLTTATLMKKVPALTSNPNARGTIKLTVTDADDATATATADLSVFNGQPTARISVNPTSGTVAAPAQVTLNGSGSTDDSGQISSYAWTITRQSDGTQVTTGTGVSYSPTLVPGVYVASLVVTDPDGQDSAHDTANGGAAIPPPTQVITVQGKPTARITSNPDNTVFVGTASTRRVTFSGTNPDPALSTTDPDTPIANLTFAWTVVDKNNQELTSWFGAAANPVDFSGFGTFRVTLTVTDPEGNSSSTFKDVIVNAKPIVVLDVNPKVITEGGTSTFAFDPKAGDPAGTRDPDGTLTAFEWKFYAPDGTTVLATRNPGSLAVESYTFPSTPGKYSATLMVTDNAGATTTERIYVRVNAKPTPVLQSGGFALQRNTGFTLDGSASSDTDSGTEATPSGIATYVWEFKDSAGTVVKTVTSALPSTTVTFGNPLISGGTVTLTVTDLDGASKTSAAQPFSVNNAKPVPVITMQPNVAVAVTPFTVTLRHSLSTDVDGSISSYHWQIFKDGGTTPVLDQTKNVITDTVNYSFTAVGSYVIRLTVVDDSGGDAFVEQTFKANDRPVAGIKDWSALTAKVGVAQAFDGSSPTYSTDSDGTVQGWAWVFRRPDGTMLTTSSVATPQVTFPSAGTYTVALTVTDDNGAQSATTATYNITVTP